MGCRLRVLDEILAEIREPIHLLKVLLDDGKGMAANLINAAGGDAAKASAAVEMALNKIPKVAGSGAGDVRLSPEIGRLFERTEEIATKAGDIYVTVERLLLAITMSSGTAAGEVLANAGVAPQSFNASIDGVRKGRKAERTFAEDNFDALEKFYVDVTAQARDGKFDSVIGRDEEVRRTIQVLARRTKNNPVLLGEPGVGKAAIVEGLAQRIVNGDVPEGLRSKRLMMLDLGALIVG